MIYQDEQQEKQDRMAFLQAMSGFMQQAVPMIQAQPELAPMAMEMLKFGVTAFKAGKQLEGIIDQTADELRTKAQQMQGQPKPPPPEIQKMQMQMQIEQAKLQANQAAEQAKVQADAQRLQMEAQIDQQKMQMQMQLEKAKQEYQAQENQLKFQLEEQRNQMDREMEVKVAQMKMMTERNTQVLLAHINNGAKIETARISAGTDDGAQAYYMEEDMAHAMQNPMDTVASAINNNSNQMATMLAEMMNKLNKPKTVVRDENGKIVGVQ
jgi:hypothetical protein